MSMITDHYHDKLKDIWKPTIPPQPWPPFQPYQPPVLTPEELAQLRRDMEEFRRLLERAREYDRKNNQPDCELEEKKRKVRELAEGLGLKVDFL